MNKKRKPRSYPAALDVINKLFSTKVLDVDCSAYIHEDYVNQKSQLIITKGEELFVIIHSEGIKVIHEEEILDFEFDWSKRSK